MIMSILAVGLIIGSFLNVCIYRIPRKEEIVYTPSHCFSCGRKINWYDLFPVISYIILKGRCRHCNQKVSIQYPIIELSNGAAYMGILTVNGYNIETALLCILFSMLLVIAMIDYKYQIIPNGLVIAILVVAGIHLAYNYTNWLEYLIGFFAVSLLLLVVGILTNGKMGGGDIKLMAAVGLFLGWKLIILALFIGSIIGSIIGISLMVLKVIKRKQPIPFGPFLSLGIIISALFGEEIIAWYLQFFI